MIPVLIAFAPLVSARVWDPTHGLLAGAILAPAQRTVTAGRPVTGLGSRPQFHRDPRVLSRAKGSELVGSRVRLGLLVAAFAPTGPLRFGIDDTGERRRGQLLGLCSLVTLLAHRRLQESASGIRQAAWSRKQPRKQHPTFADALALVRHELWRPHTLSPHFVSISRTGEIVELPRAVVDRFTDKLGSGACRAEVELRRSVGGRQPLPARSQFWTRRNQGGHEPGWLVFTRRRSSRYASCAPAGLRRMPGSVADMVNAYGLQVRQGSVGAVIRYCHGLGSACGSPPVS
jgi:hypothetical protein